MIVPLIGAEVPLDEISQCATPTQDDPPKSAEQARYLPGDIYKKRYTPPIWADRPERRPGDSHASWAQGFVFSALISQGLRFIRRNPEVEIDELAKLLEDFYPSAIAEVDPDARMIHPYDAFHGGDKTPAWLDWDQVPTQARNAAGSALEKYSAEWVEKHRQMSSKGGKARSYDVHDYLAHRNDRFVAQTAREMNRDPDTVRAMKKRYAKYTENQLQEIARGERPDE